MELYTVASLNGVQKSEKINDNRKRQRSKKEEDTSERSEDSVELTQLDDEETQRFEHSQNEKGSQSYGSSINILAE